MSYQISIFLAKSYQSQAVSAPKKLPATQQPPLRFREMFQARGTLGQQRQQHRGPGGGISPLNILENLKT
jgi:hypothetical protein